MDRRTAARLAIGAALCTLGLLGPLAACSLVVSTDGLAGGVADGGGSTPDALADGIAPSDAGADVVAPLSASCRALHEAQKDAKTGPYDLAADGGQVLHAYCDMESFDGGWTLVTPAMIVENKGIQDYNTNAKTHVTVQTGTDVHGGAQVSATTTIDNCGQRPPVGPAHYLLVGELDGWTQIMATYTFLSSASCWHVFGDPDGPDVNVMRFTPGVDLIDRQVNMGRDATGAAVPFDGRTYQCNNDATNFWHDAYAMDVKTARVVLRRSLQIRPAGLSIAEDCGLASWIFSDIYVR